MRLEDTCEMLECQEGRETGCHLCKASGALSETNKGGDSQLQRASFGKLQRTGQEPGLGHRPVTQFRRVDESLRGWHRAGKEARLT